MRNWEELQQKSYYDATARERAIGLVDEETFHELLGPKDKFSSPHLPVLGEVYEFDDGMTVGVGKIDQRPVFIISQEGKFIGGSIGEINGTKMATTLQLALEAYHKINVEKPEEREAKRPVVLISFDTGGVRLHEANCGLLAHAEVMEAIQAARGKVPIFSLVGSQVGCFGGMGFVCISTDVLIMSEQGRVGLTGPEVIEQEVGRKEFDASDRSLVWRTTGGKHKYIIRDCNFLVADSIGAFRQQLKKLVYLPYAEIKKYRKIGSRQLVEEQLALIDFCIEHDILDSRDLWEIFGNSHPKSISEISLEAFLNTVNRRP